MATEAEIIQRVVTDCADPETTRCRLWRCQKAMKCQMHDYRKSLGEAMDAIEAKPSENAAS